jgi:16S rRNA (guanine(966)-N(2))-methyltransferase RsmD
MRIYGNRELKTLPGQLTRPTTAKVRTALFNIWRDIEGCSWLDLCAGNGSMGAEALSRGAQKVVGIEQSGKACAVIQENWQKLSRPSQTFRILRGHVLTQLSHWQGNLFDYIYFDPPYESNLYESVLTAIATKGLLQSEGEIAVEHDPKCWVAQEISTLAICRQKHYGKTSLTFYQWDN